ncbi:uncharacterized protein LOC142976790 [Anticarsia gemmatalis]|uniref:uncharacterized protein LOC142976790 n=1 Tax=Anticarsia gemmatalis TaxID=129554 RepID=UPI003F76E389
MSEDKYSNSRQVVTSVGKSWIMTHSKSHPGHVYYFNTLTGEAVWNLSNSEIEKARLRSKSIEGQPGLNTTVCTEPIGNPPIHQLLQNEFNRIDKLNQDRMNIMNTQQAPSNMLQQQTVFTDIQMSSIPQFNLNNLNNQINAFNIIRAPTVYPNIWQIPPTQQTFITPAVPIVNQVGDSLNRPYNEVIRNNQTISSRFNNLNNKQVLRKRLFHPKNRPAFGKQTFRNNFKSPKRRNDLRQQLSLKNRLNFRNNMPNAGPNSTVVETNKDASTSTRTTFKTADVSSYIADMIEKECNPSDNNSLANSNSCKQNEAETNLKTLDITPLKCLAPAGVYKHIWCIVVDLNVLLNEFEFLTTLSHSDETCHLTIPQVVMTELKDYIAKTNNIPARRIYLSLLPKIENGSVLIGYEPSKDTEDNIITSSILRTCLDLLEQNYHVIFLTGDTKMLSYKKFIKINMFTIDEVKSLLEGDCQPIEHSTDSQAVFGCSKSNCPPRTFKPPTTNPPATKTDTKECAETIEISDSEMNENAEDEKTILPLKCPANATEKVTSPMDNVKAKDESTPAIVPKPKRREIRLKRNLSNQPIDSSSIVTKSNDKKSFRWRRRPNRSSESDTRTSGNNKPRNTNEETGVNTETKTKTSEMVRVDQEINNSYDHDRSSSTDEKIESRESSIICMDVARENIIIEETSTSGVISNTESTVDIPSYYNTEQNNFNEGSYDEVDNIVMYEIENESMELSLKTKCVEYVCRFIHIMEKVLVSVFRSEPTYSDRNSTSPTLLSLREIVQCITIYCNYNTVQIATDKLSSLLFDLSDCAGNLTDIEPSQFMEMYSYGVSLLSAIKAVEVNCEDIETALESLKNLLEDIKCPSHGTNDTVVRNGSKERSSNTLMQTEDASSKPENECRLLKLNVDKYNLRSQSRAPQPEPTAVKIIRNIDIKSSFFRNLNLMQNPFRTENETECESNDQVNEKRQITFSTGDNFTSGSLNTPNIVRSFTKCAEFEERLKNKDIHNEFDEYSDNAVEDYENTFDDSDECDTSDSDSVQSDPNVTQLFESSDLDIPENFAASSPKTLDPCVDNEGNKTFRLMTCMFLQEVRKAIDEVRLLCDKCFVELRNPQLSIGKKSELRKSVESAQTHLFGLCKSLEGMLNRDPEAPTDNIQTALKKAGIDISQIDKHLFIGYWDTIANCKKHADVYLRTIREIIAAFKFPE